jgi:hypothetical protein
MTDEKANLELAVILEKEVLAQLHQQEHVPEDVLDLLWEGDPEVGVRPGALRRAIVNAMRAIHPASESEGS